MRRVVLLAIGMFALGMDAFVVAGLIPQIASSSHVSESSVGQMVTVFTLSYAVSGPLLSSVLHSVSTRTILLAALVVFTVGNLGTALSDSFAVLLLSRAVAGIGAGLYSPTAASTAAHLVAPERRGRALSIILGGMSVGTVLGVPVGLLLARSHGWKTALWVIVVIGVVAVVGVGRFLPPVRLPALPGVGARLATLVDRRVAPVVLVSLLVNIASLGLYTYIAPVLRASAGVTDPTLLLWIWGLGGIVGAFAIGPVLDRFSRTPRVMAVVLVMFVVSTAAITPAGGVLVGVGLAMAVWGAAGFGSPPPQQHLLLERAPERGPVAVALNASAIYLGSAIGSSLGGIALHAGLPAANLPLVAAGFALLALFVHTVVVAPGRASRGPAVRQPEQVGR